MAANRCSKAVERGNTQLISGAPEPDASVVRQGWLGKKDHLFRRWKKMYFVLRTDGSILGYDSNPRNHQREHIYKFLIKNCQITICNKMSKQGSYKFHIKGTHWTSLFSRTFRAESDLNRTLWLQALRFVNEEVTLKRSVPRQVLFATIGGAKSESSTDEVATTLTASVEGAGELVPSAIHTIDGFLRLCLLGQGSFGRVELNRERATGRLFAIKTISKLVVFKDGDVSAHTEQQIFSMCEHPFLTKLHACLESEIHMCFVMEYANGGNLSKHIERCKRLTEPEACLYAAQVVAGVGYLHSHAVIYRDLKAENILIASDGYLKLTDFGLAKNVGNSEGTAHALCGTLAYVAPEVLALKEYGRAVDWWSLGVLVFEMLSGSLPFSSASGSTSVRKILSYPIGYPRYTSILARSFMSKLLQRNPSERLGSGTDDYIEVQRHQFFETIDWTQLLQKKIPPFFVPRLTSDDDTRYFCDDPKTK